MKQQHRQLRQPQDELTVTITLLDCAWCADEQRVPPTESPGICDVHAQAIEQQAKERKRRQETRP